MSGEPLRVSGNTLFHLATGVDDVELRATLRASPLPGWTSIAYEREGCYFDACRAEGPFAQAVVARHRDSGELIGFFTRSCREAFVAGRRLRLGYLGQLRLTPAWQARSRAILRGFEVCRQLLGDGQQDTPYYLTSLLAGNRRAERMLTSSLQGLPSYRSLTEYTTLVFSTGQRLPARLPTGCTLARGSAAALEEIAELLLAEGRRRTFHSVWTAAELLHLGERGLAPKDFFLLRRGGRPIACLALWDQRRFKQLRIHAYAPPLATLRPLVNLGLRTAGYPQLPPTGSVLRQAFISHVAVEGDNEEAFLALLAAALSEARTRGIDMATTGFCAGHPLLAAAQRRLKTLAYRSRLYLVHWSEGEAEASRLAGLPLHTEAACL